MRLLRVVPAILQDTAHRNQRVRGGGGRGQYDGIPRLQNSKVSKNAHLHDLITKLF